MIDKIQLGLRLKTLRNKKNMTMNDVAVYVGASGRSTINSWEKGRTIPSKNSLEMLSKLYGLKTEKILYGDETSYINAILTYILDNEDQYKDINDKISKYLKIAINLNNVDDFAQEHLSDMSPVEFVDEVQNKYNEEAHKAMSPIIEIVSNKIKDDSISYFNFEKVMTILKVTIDEYIDKNFNTFIGQQNLLNHYMNKFKINYKFSSMNFKSLEEYLEFNKDNVDLKKDIDNYYRDKLINDIRTFVIKETTLLSKEYDDNINKYLKK